MPTKNEIFSTYEAFESLPEICGVADVLAAFPVSRATIYRMAAQGRLPSFRVGRRVLFSRSHLLRWLDGELAGWPNSQQGY